MLEKAKKSISMKSAAPLVGTPKAFRLARNFVGWSGLEGEGKGLVGTCFLWFGVGLGSHAQSCLVGT